MSIFYFVASVLFVAAPEEKEYEWFVPTDVSVTCESAERVITELESSLYQEAFTEGIPSLIQKRSTSNTFTVSDALLLLRLEQSVLQIKSLIAEMQFVRSFCTLTTDEERGKMREWILNQTNSKGTT